MFEPAWKRHIKAFLYLLPALVIIATFVVYPMINSVWMSFYTKYNIFKHTGSQLGAENYVEVLSDDRFLLALKNTSIYTGIVVPVSMIIALLIAVLLNTKMKGMKIFETIFFLPYITNIIAIGLAFKFIMHSEYGVLNMLLGAVGIDTVRWLNDPHYSLPALIIFGIWSGLAFKIVVFLAGIQSINRQYYQAAQIDGASAWRTFRHITLPMLSPMVAYIAVISLIGSFKTYVEVVGLFGDAGPADSAITIVYYVYDKFYQSNNPPVAAAASVILFLIILVFTLIQLRINRKSVHY